MPRQRAADRSPAAKRYVSVTYIVQAFWDEDRNLSDDVTDRVVVAEPEQYIDTELEALGRQQEEVARIQRDGLGRTFAEVGLWSRKWTRGDDDELRWLGSKQEIQVIDALLGSSVVDSGEPPARGGT